MGARLLRPLFWLEPERAHGLVLTFLEWLGSQPELQDAIARIFRYEDPRLGRELFGLKFKNPVGLAAGFDKDARAVRGLAALGFGFLEVGSVSAHPSSGNTKPRIFRLEKDKAIINRMGIPSEGADQVAARLARLEARPVPLGINLNFTTGISLDREGIIQDYLSSFRRLYPYADYFAINLSCPNLPEAEFDPTDPEDLEALLHGLAEERGKLGVPKPLLVKLSPDLEETELDRVLGASHQYIDGIIAVNTTTSREGLRTQDRELIAQEGGLSGAPLRAQATRVIAEVYRKTEGKLPIIGVGGIFTAEEAWEKLRAGASLVQIYTGLIYKGPGIAKRINRGLVRLLEEHGYRNIAEVVGSGVQL
jgi:dihydroorotate dehydrogenase